MHNDFIIVGPASDPAGVRRDKDADAAMKLSPTSRRLCQPRRRVRHERAGTEALEGRPNITPAGQAWYQESGQGMGATLQVASQKNGYTITGPRHVPRTQKNIDLDILFQGDPALLNVYHVIVVNPAKHPKVNVVGARAFAAYVVRPDIQAHDRRLRQGQVRARAVLPGRRQAGADAVVRRDNRAGAGRRGEYAGVGVEASDCRHDDEGTAATGGRGALTTDDGGGDGPDLAGPEGRGAAPRAQRPLRLLDRPRSIYVSGVATLVSLVLGVGIGAVLAFRRFPGRLLAMTLVNTGMGFPPVVIGLFVAILLWRSGPLGDLDWIYTTRAMIIAQVIIAAPVITGFTAASLAALDPKLRLQVYALGASRLQMLWILLREVRLPLLAAVMAGFGAAISEVGASVMAGGNIAGQTRC